VSQTLQNTFEYSSLGTALSTANGGTLDGASTKFNTVTDNNANGGSLVLDATHGAARGTRALKVVNGTSSSPVIAWGSSTITAAPTTAWGRIYFYWTANPSATLRMARFQGTSSANLCDINVTTGGLINLLDASQTNQKAFTGAVPLNQWNRLEWKLVSNASTGSLQAWLYAGDSTSAIETQTASGINTGGTGVTNLSFPSLLAIAGNFTQWVDEIGYSDVGALGPSTTPNPTVDTDFSFGVIRF
jgi:hypothetical protein